MEIGAPQQFDGDGQLGKARRRKDLVRSQAHAPIRLLARRWASDALRGDGEAPTGNLEEGGNAPGKRRHACGWLFGCCGVSRLAARRMCAHKYALSFGDGWYRIS